MTKREMLENLEVQVGVLAQRMDTRTRELADLGGRVDILHAALKALTTRVETLELSVSTRDYRVPLPEVTDSHGNRRSLLMDFQESVPAPVLPSTPEQAHMAGRTYFVPGEEGWKVYTLDTAQHAQVRQLRTRGLSIPDALAAVGVEPEPREGVAP